MSRSTVRELGSGLVVYSAASYQADVRAMILGAKRTGASELLSPLVQLVVPLVASQCAATSLAQSWSDRSLVVVPVHSGRETRERLGMDLSAWLARRAVACVRKGGAAVEMMDLLRPAQSAVAQKGRDARARAASAANSMKYSQPDMPVANRCVVIFDDVVTTGSTLLEANRVLQNRGICVQAAVTIASTVPRRDRRSAD